MVGKPFMINAAYTGARAHRLRYLWTNLIEIPIEVLYKMKAQTITPPHITIQQNNFEPGRRPSLGQLHREMKKGQYPCNKIGLPREFLPTRVISPTSYALRHNGAGMMYDKKTDSWTEQTPFERERAMGMMGNASYHPMLTWKRQ